MSATQEFANYVKSAQAGGMSVGDIKVALRANGWEEADIDAGFAVLMSAQQTDPYVDKQTSNHLAGSTKEGFGGNQKKSGVETVSKKYSGKTSTTKFIVLCFATFGIYILFWMYDQWKFLKREQNLDVSPLARAFFGALWAGSLASNTQKFLKEKNIMVSYNSFLLGGSFFILTVLSKLPDPYWLVTSLAFVPTMPILKGMNQYYEENEANLPKASLAWWQVVLTGIGLLLFMVTAYVTFYP